MAKRIGADKARKSDTLASSLGAEITRLRLEKGWSQLRFADVLGYDERYIRELEQGTKSPTLRTLESIAKAFEIPVSKLLKEAERRIVTRYKSTTQRLS